MDPEELQRARTKQWLEIYDIIERLKEGDVIILPEYLSNVLKDNILNSSILNNAPTHVSKKIMDIQPELVSKPNKSSNLSLHFAVAAKNRDRNFINSLIDKYKEALKSRNDSGNLPLHLAILNEDLDINTIKLVFNRDPSAAKIQNNNGNLPIHLGMYSKKPDTDLIIALYKAYPESINVRNNAGNTAENVMNVDYFRNNLDKVRQINTLIIKLREELKAKEALKREKKAIRRQAKAAEAERQSKIQALTNRSKERQATVIQQKFRRHLQQQRAAKKGINPSAAPFVPSRKPPPPRLLRSSSAPAIMKVYPQLPDDTSVRLPWVGVNYIEGRPKRYFNFGRTRSKRSKTKRLKQLKIDLKRLKF